MSNEFTRVVDVTFARDFNNNVGVLPACIMLADLRLERRTAVAV